MRRKLKRIMGLSWLQKLAIEEALTTAMTRAIVEDETMPDDLWLAPSFLKTLRMFKTKTKWMRKPKRRRRK